MGKVIDGRDYANNIKQRLTEKTKQLKRDGVVPSLAAVLATDNRGAHIYARNQKKACAEVGIDYHLVELSTTCNEDDLSEHIDDLNNNPDIDGIIVQSPLPEDVDQRHIQSIIVAAKDVEGVTRANQGRVIYAAQPYFAKPEAIDEEKWLEESLGWPLPSPAPCTAIGIMELIRSLKIDLYGMNAVVVGHSEIVGKPVALLLMAHFCTTTICHVATQDLKAHTCNADLLVVAAGKAGLVSGDMIKPGAIVIDAGINRIKAPEGAKKKTRIVGDVDYEDAESVASHITPVPGGVGPMTTAILLRNTVEACGRHRR